MRDVKPVVDTFRALIPMNPVKAMADTNVIAVVIFGVVIGGIAQLIKKWDDCICIQLSGKDRCT